MTNPQINIASLDFDSIKASLISYIKSNPKSPFADYDTTTSGSALDSLLDVFAYNSMLYSYYSNMIANESFLGTATLENNIISLLKPLGVLIDGKTCAKSTIKVSGTGSITAYTTAFSTSLSSTLYNFYTKTDYTLTTTPTEIEIYEANSVVKDFPLVVDTNTQTVFLSNSSIDINSLLVKVNGVTWTKMNYNAYDPGPSANVYFVDRNSDGFYLIFGKKTLNDYQSTFGKNIISTDTVTVTYLIPSGSVANGLSNFSSTGVTIAVGGAVSTNGTDGPDLDLYKYFAPKLFAANDRLVTKDDYYGVLLNSNTLPSGIVSKEQINVWDGQEMNTPAYGRVFVSFSDTALTKTTTSLQPSIALLKSKNIVGVLPEYVQSYNIFVDLYVGVYGTSVEGITFASKTLIDTAYNNKFNTTISPNTLTTLIKNKFNSTQEGIPNVIRVDVQGITLSLNVIGSSSVPKYVDFGNRLKEVPYTTTPLKGSVVSSSGFTFDFSTNKDGTDSQLTALKDLPTIRGLTANGTFSIFVAGDLVIDKSSGSSKTVGMVDYLSGYININRDILPTTSTKINAVAKSLNPIISRNEVVFSVNSNVIQVMA